MLEIVRHSFCTHIHVLPEAAGVLFGGGFPRSDELESKRAAQRAVFYMQRELEAHASAQNLAIVLCDRGTVAGAAHWTGPGDLWSAVGTTLDEQFARYSVVIHLRTPAVTQGYKHQNPLRIETAVEASAIDARILQAWDGRAPTSYGRRTL